MMDRRSFLIAGSIGSVVNLSSPARADSTPPNDFGFVGPADDPTFGPIITGHALGGHAVGTGPSRSDEVAKAFRLLFDAPRVDDNFKIAQYFEAIKDKNASMEPYNYEWHKTGDANPLITGFFSMTNTKPSDGDQTYWCAAFVSFCLRAANKKTQFSALSGSYRTYSTSTTSPKRGDVVVFADYGLSGSQGHGHVAFFDSMVGDKIRVLGGNQRGDTGSTGAVCYAEFPKTGASMQLHSFRSVI